MRTDGKHDQNKTAGIKMKRTGIPVKWKILVTSFLSFEHGV